MSAPTLAATTTEAERQRTGGRPPIPFVVRRRVTISVVLFTALALLDIFLIDNRPRNITHWHSPVIVVAELMILTGLVIRSWAAGTLRKKKQLATTGPYAWVRNPLYIGSFLMMAGFSMLVHDPVSIWLVIGPVAALYALAVRHEEQTLAALFPDEWPQYRERVPAFLPRRLILPRAGRWSFAGWLLNREYQAWLGTAAGLAGIYAWRLWL